MSEGSWGLLAASLRVRLSVLPCENVWKVVVQVCVDATWQNCSFLLFLFFCCCCLQLH